ncbi:MAG: hypothetical protein JWO82_4385 [Akkermansiaceae bacterium]|nr:hypothetical protein [Akkermansiaceae bacterium]
MKPRSHNRIAMILSVLAAGCFVLFHFLPLATLGIRGPDVAKLDLPDSLPTQVWSDMWYWLTHPKDLLDEPLLLAFTPAFLLASLGFAAMPFVIRALSHSRLLWWTVTLVWFMAAVAICYEMVVVFELITAQVNGEAHLGSGLGCLFLGLQLQLVALFFVRRSGEVARSTEIR